VELPLVILIELSWPWMGWRYDIVWVVGRVRGRCAESKLGMAIALKADI
jgi:hypothetical protein